MNSKFNPVRWATVVMLGCLLGLIFVFVSLAFRPGADDHRKRSVRFTRTVVLLRLSNNSVKGDLIKVVDSQLAAFRRGDYPRAYTFAGSQVHLQYPLPLFERMVKIGYPVIARSHSEQFGVILDNGEEAVVNVGLLDESGRLFHYQYFLKREQAGWKINGVSEVRFEGTIT
jgi:hypothetical protein